ASLTQTTPAEIEALFELSKPAAEIRKAPPRQGRQPPMGLELKILRPLVAHPQLALALDAEALRAFDFFGPESSDRLAQLVAVAQALGEHGGFAALAQHLKQNGPEYDGLIGEIVAEPESDIETDRVWLLAPVRRSEERRVGNAG